MSFYRLAIALFSLTPFSVSTSAQKQLELMYKPAHYYDPLNYKGEDNLKYLREKGKDNIKKETWVVFSDRDNNQCYSQANSTYPNVKTMKFMESFYVSEQTEDWIHVHKLGQLPSGNKTRLGTHTEDYGWVEKSKMLLWTSGLRDVNTKIYLKSFILYKLSVVQELLAGNTQNAAPILKGPESRYGRSKEINLYDFYYIFKEENGFLLLAKEVQTTAGTIESHIIGWVKDTYQAKWNTRLTLEPNFAKEAFEERKNNPNFQIQYYDNNASALQHNRSGKIQDKPMVNNADPVTNEGSYDAEDRRMPGSIMRLPVLSPFEGYYYTGVVKTLPANNVEIEDSKRAKMQDEYNRMRSEKDKFDILFVIEATRSMQDRKELIQQSIRNIQQSLVNGQKPRFAVAFYRDPKFTSKPYFSITPFTEDVNEVTESIKNQPFTSDDFDVYTTMYYGIEQAVLQAGFGYNHTNVVMVIGNNPDFNYNILLDAKCDKCTEKVNVDNLVKKISDFRAHLFFIQPEQKDAGLRQDYVDQTQNILLEVSKRNHGSYYADLEHLNSQLRREVRAGNPEVNEQESGNGRIFITDGSTKGEIFFPAKEAYSGSKLTKIIKSSIEDLVEFQENTFQLMDKVLNDGVALKTITAKDLGLGKNADIGQYTPAVFDKINEIMKRSKASLSQSQKESLISKNLRFYTDAYTPRKIAGAKYEMYSPVLFFPKRELDDYIDDLRKISAVQDMPDDEKRKALKDALISLFEKFAAEGKNKKGISKESDLAALSMMLIGNGIPIKPKTNFIIRDITDRRQVPESTVNGFVQDINEKIIKLEGIIRSGSYKYKYVSSGNEYFWIPFESTF